MGDYRTKDVIKFYALASSTKSLSRERNVSNIFPAITTTLTLCLRRQHGCRDSKNIGTDGATPSQKRQNKWCICPGARSANKYFERLGVGGCLSLIKIIWDKRHDIMPLEVRFLNSKKR